MEKKIKDLTQEEINKICKKFDMAQCNNGVCPLSTGRKECKADNVRYYGEQTIEVKE